MKRTISVGHAFKSLVKSLRHPLKSFKNLSSNGKLAFILVCILLIIGLGSVIYVMGSRDEETIEVSNNDFDTQLSTLTPLKASITRIEGTVYYKTVSGEWEQATLETEVNTEDEIKTEGAASRAIVTFDNKSEMRLDGDTHVRIDATTEEKIETFVLNGKTYNRVTTNSIPYSVETDNAHYEALGTAFIAEASGDKQSVDVIESSVIETTTNNTISEGNRYIVKSAVNPSDDKKIEKLDINSFKTDPFVEWNLEIDKSRDEFKNNLGFLQDTEAPEISIESPKQDEIILTEASSETGAVTIKGKATSAVTIKIIAKSISGSPVTDVTVASDGSFTAPAIDTPLGLAVFEIEAKDRVGNVATQSLRVTIQQKSAPAEDNSSSLLLLKSATYQDGKIQLTWFIPSAVDDNNLRIIYSENENPTWQSKSGDLTPKKGAKPPATITNSFNLDLDQDKTYYFRLCELNDSESDCKTLSNSLVVTKEE